MSEQQAASSTGRITEVPSPLPGESMEDWVNRSYATDEAGNVMCLRCGAIVGSGWQMRHYESLHAFKGF